MQLDRYLTNQTIRIFADSGSPAPERRSPVPIFRELENRYGFVQIPRTVDEVNLQTGITFARGFFKGKVIEKFQIYENGILCQAEENTDFCDEVLEDILSWMPKFFSEGQELKIASRAYINQMVVKSNSNALKILQGLNAIGEQISTLREAYDQSVSPYKAIGFRMNSDPDDQKLARAPDFIFERRAGLPFADETYFTSAPVTTADHWKLLTSLEKLLI